MLISLVLKKYMTKFLTFSDCAKWHPNSIGPRRDRQSDQRCKQHLPSIKKQCDRFVHNVTTTFKCPHQRNRIWQLHNKLLCLCWRSAVVVHYQAVHVGPAQCGVWASFQRFNQKYFVCGRWYGKTKETRSHGLQGKTICRPQI